MAKYSELKADLASARAQLEQLREALRWATSYIEYRGGIEADDPEAPIDRRMFEKAVALETVPAARTPEACDARDAWYVRCELPANHGGFHEATTEGRTYSFGPTARTPEGDDE